MLINDHSLLFDATTSAWLQNDSTSPLEGWSMQSIQDPSNLQRTVRNDMNGLLYFHIRTVVKDFCSRIQHSPSKIHFILYSLDAATLPSTFSVQVQTMGFDRIEVSNIADEGFLGLLRTLQTFGPLLKRPNHNPNASLITLFLNACEIADREMGNDANKAILEQQLKQAVSYFHLDPLQVLGMRNDSVMTMRIMMARSLLRDYDRIFEFYTDQLDFSKLADSAGVKMRKRNKVVEAWPMRLQKKYGEDGADEEFGALMASSHTGAERYVEWVRKE